MYKYVIMSVEAEQIFKKINTSVESALKDILKDISKRYDVNLEDLENEFLNETTKKRKNGYNKYNSKRRKELLDKKPNMDFGEMSKIIGKEWATMTKKDKELYNQK